MNIESFEKVISACRFCFMCRHLSAVGNVSCREADTPRGRALIADRARMNKETLGNADFVNCIYNSDLAGANRFHCDGYHAGAGYDEVGLQLALRRDIVEAGFAPEKVKAIAKDLETTEQWEVSGKADILYFVDPYSAGRPGVAKGFKKVADKAKVKYATLTGGCIGKGLGVLGFAKESKAAMKKFAAFLKETGVKTLVVSSPAAADALKVDYPANGVKLSCKVLHTSEFFVELAKDKKIGFAKAKKSASYLASDFLKNYLKMDSAEQLLKLMNVENVMFGTNVEESWSCGEGALVLDRINPELVAQMAGRAAQQVEAKGKILVASAHTATVLARAGMDVKTLEEAAGEYVC